jgi:hypothetical protein
VRHRVIACAHRGRNGHPISGAGAASVVGMLVPGLSSDGMLASSIWL